MKKLLFIAFTFASMYSYSQSVEYLLDESTLSVNEKYSQKSVEKYYEARKIDNVSGFLKIGLGISPTHSRAFAEWQIGATYKFIEISASALPSLTRDNIHVFNGKVGVKFPVNKMFTVTPNIGYWTFWDGKEVISWGGGNHFVYGVDIDRRVYDNINLVASWIDCRSDIGKYNGMKIGSLGLKYIF